MNDEATSPQELGADNSYSLATPTVRGYGSLAGRYYTNLEKLPGDVFAKPSVQSPRAEIEIGRDYAVRAARQLERSNPHLIGAQDTNVQMTIGAALRVMPQPNWKLLQRINPKFDREWARDYSAAQYEQFNDWGYDQRRLCDAEGDRDFGGLMALAYRYYVSATAESFGAIHYDQERADAYGSDWATYITIVDSSLVSTPPEFAGDPFVREGRELDRNGRMTAFYAQTEWASDNPLEALTWERVPRENNMGRPMGWHYFNKARSGAQRGLTKWITIIRSTGMFDDFDDAMLGQATKQAHLATYVETLASAETVAQQMAPAGKDGASPWDEKLGYYGQVNLRMGNQKLVIMPPGDKIMMQGMASALADPTSLRNGYLRNFASATGVSFEQISKNFSEANYSSARAALLEVWRGVIFERTLFSGAVPAQCYSAVAEEAIAKEKIKLPANAPDFYKYRSAYVGCSFTGPAMGWIDPQKEAAAQAIRLANKTTTREIEIAQQGGDWREYFEQLSEENDMAGELGITLEPIANTKAANSALEPGPDDPADPNNPDNPPKPKPKPAPPQPAN